MLACEVLFGILSHIGISHMCIPCKIRNSCIYTKCLPGSVEYHEKCTRGCHANAQNVPINTNLPQNNGILALMIRDYFVYRHNYPFSNGTLTELRMTNNSSMGVLSLL
jgi:hypothetical protein